LALLRQKCEAAAFSPQKARLTKAGWCGQLLLLQECAVFFFLKAKKNVWGVAKIFIF